MMTVLFLESILYHLVYDYYIAIKFKAEAKKDMFKKY